MNILNYFFISISHYYNPIFILNMNEYLNINSNIIPSVKITIFLNLIINFLLCYLQFIVLQIMILIIFNIISY